MERLIVPFRRWHYEWLIADKSSEGSPVRLNDRVLERVEQCNSWTGVVDGEPIAVAGTMEQWPGRHMAWAYLADSTASHMTWVTLATRRKLRDVKGRLELTVREDFAAGHRWARLLGFEVESPCLKRYGPRGENHVGYSRFNE